MSNASSRGGAVPCFKDLSIYISVLYPNMHILWPICIYPCKEGYGQDVMVNIPPYLYLWWPSGHVFDHARWCKCTDYHRRTSLFSITVDPTRSKAMAKYDIAHYNVYTVKIPIHQQRAEQMWLLELNQMCRKTNLVFLIFKDVLENSFKVFSALWLWQ